MSLLGKDNVINKLEQHRKELLGLWKALKSVANGKQLQMIEIIICELDLTKKIVAGCLEDKKGDNKMDRKEMTDEEAREEKEKARMIFAKVNELTLRDDQQVLDKIGRIRKLNLDTYSAVIVETLSLCLVRDPYPLINEILDLIEHNKLLP